jgi:hypothetical protein
MGDSNSSQSVVSEGRSTGVRLRRAGVRSLLVGRSPLHRARKDSNVLFVSSVSGSDVLRRPRTLFASDCETSIETGRLSFLPGAARRRARNESDGERGGSISSDAAVELDTFRLNRSDRGGENCCGGRFSGDASLRSEWRDRVECVSPSPGRGWNGMVGLMSASLLPHMASTLGRAVVLPTCRSVDRSDDALVQLPHSSSELDAWWRGGRFVDDDVDAPSIHPDDAAAGASDLAVRGTHAGVGASERNS